MPRPVARANGKLATAPINMVKIPATKAVVAAIAARLGASPPPRNLPSTSCVNPKISGFRTTM